MAKDKNNEKLVVAPNEFASFDMSSIKFGLPEEEEKPAKKVVNKAEGKTEDEDEEDTSTDNGRVIPVGEEEEKFANFFDKSREEDEEDTDEESGSGKDDKENSAEEEPSTLFETMVEMGLLMLPDDFEFDGTEEGLQKAVELDFEARQELAAQEITNRIADPKVQEIVDAAIKGGKFLDIEKYFKNQREEFDFENIDLSTEDKQKDFLRNIYKQKGMKPSQIEALIETAEADNTLETDSEEERAAIITAKSNARKLMAEKARKDALKDRDDQIAYERQLSAALKESQLPLSRKQKVIASLQNIVEVGQTRMPEWQYKILLMQQNQADFIQLIDLVSSYDPKQGFKKPAQEDKTKEKSEKNRTLLSKITSGTGKVSKGGSGNGSQSKPTFIPVSPEKRRTTTY